MKSAGINFGIPDSEYIVRVDGSGAATSCYNQDTDTEYIGGGGGGIGEEVTVNIVNNDTETYRPTILYSIVTNGVAEGLRIYNGEYYYDEYEIAELLGETMQERTYLKLGEYIYIQVPSFATASGNAEIVFLESLEINAAKISGDCTITIPLLG